MKNNKDSLGGELVRVTKLNNFFSKNVWISLYGDKTYVCRVWARPRHCTNPTLQLKLSLKKTAKATICPLQNLGKKLERKHTRRHLVQYRNCKLKQNVESTFYGTFKVHSKVTFQSRSTKHERLMLNLAWWMHLAILKHVTSKTCSNIRKLFRSKSKPEWIREKWYRRITVY